MGNICVLKFRTFSEKPNVAKRSESSKLRLNFGRIQWANVNFVVWEVDHIFNIPVRWCCSRDWFGACYSPSFEFILEKLKYPSYFVYYIRLQCSTVFSLNIVWNNTYPSLVLRGHRQRAHRSPLAWQVTSRQTTSYNEGFFTSISNVSSMWSSSYREIVNHELSWIIMTLHRILLFHLSC